MNAFRIIISNRIVVYLDVLRIVIYVLHNLAVKYVRMVLISIIRFALFLIVNLMSTMINRALDVKNVMILVTDAIEVNHPTVYLAITI